MENKMKTNLQFGIQVFQKIRDMLIDESNATELEEFSEIEVTILSVLDILQKKDAFNIMVLGQDQFTQTVLISKKED